MKKIIICVCLAVIAIAGVVLGVGYYRMQSIKNSRTYILYYDENYFSSNQEGTNVLPGTDVEMVFLKNDPDVNYTFSLVGVKKYNIDENEETGIVTIKFTMPAAHVSVYYEVDEPFDGISITMDENITTGFEWTYTIDQDDILEEVENRYVTDPNDGEPVSGLGGTHYWKFKVVGDGTVDITFQLLRGSEFGRAKTYRYTCEGNSATLVEIIDLEFEDLYE